VQAQRDGDWVDLDPSFVSTQPGVAVGSNAVVIEGLPDDLIASVHVALRRGDVTVAEATFPGSAAVGQVIELSFTAQSAEAVALWRESETAARRFSAVLHDVAQSLGWIAGAAGPLDPAPTSADEGRSVEAAPRRRTFPVPSRPSAFQRIVLDPAAGPWVARLAVPGRTIEAGPFERTELDSFEIQVTVRAPLVSDHVTRVPWGGGAAGWLTVVVGAGRVSDARLAAEADPLYRSLNRLAGLEQEARGAMTPPVQYRSAADDLEEAARDGWDTFSRTAPRVLGWAVLHGIGRVSERSASGRVIRQGLRLAAVRWRPVEGDGERGDTGSIEIQVSDPVTIGALEGDVSAASLRAANGVLQSAVLSQVLNRVAEKAPETAFDVTLRAIGTRRPIAVYRDAADLPESWPATVRATTSIGLRAGYAVLAPESFDDGAVGWWHVGIFDGETLGWVPAPHGALHGRVDMDAPVRTDDLESLLASLPALHRALRWLADLPGSGSMSLSAVPAAACSSAAVASGVMAVSVQDPWPRPDVPALCGTR
jgi:hypothetical protein